MTTPKISVIIAVYNAEPYIERCVHSLLGQTLNNVEYIFVNDGSTDNSMGVLRTISNEYPERVNNIQIVDLEKNTGVANARTVGMKLATGKYMIHCDSDDYFEADALEVLYEKAVKSNADIVVCDYFREKGNRTVYCAQSYAQTPRECIKDFYKQPFFPSLWSTLIRTSIIQENQIYPFKGINTGEDLNVIFRAFLNADSLVYVNRALYHYELRKGSLTQNKDIKELWDANINSNLLLLSEYLDSQNITTGGGYLATKHYLQYTKKLMLLQCDTPYYELWFSSYKECVKSLRLFSGFSTKHKCVMRLFAKYHFLLVTYYRLLRPIGLRII